MASLDDGAEPELIGVTVNLSAVIDRLLISGLEGESDPVALTLEQCELGLDLYVTCLQILAQRLIKAAWLPNEPPIGNAH